jgi:ASC-1-like (ASCH) protein
MIRQSGEREEGKNGRKKVARRVNSGSQNHVPPTDTSIFDEIDPADFWDPEEFRIWRQGQSHEP